MRGKNKYVPRIVIDEISSIKKSENIRADNLAFRKMVEHCRVGREMERIAKFDFTRPPLDTKSIFKGVKRWR